jgi:hypothetical protein
MSAAEDFSYLQGVVAPVRITEGITNRQMSILLKEASVEMDDVIAKYAGSGSTIVQMRAKELGALKIGIDQISTELWTQTGKLTEVGMFAQAQLAVEQALDRDLIGGMPGQAIAQYARGQHLSASAGIRAVLSRRTGGFMLADSIYAGGQKTTKAVGRIVEKALIKQTSARDLSKQVRGHFRPDVPGGTSYASFRLARTEINNAHHATSISQGEARPWVLGYEWNLSRSHPRPDPCDVLANADNFGLGAGVYSKGNAPDRPHPQCLCYLTHQTEDADALVSQLANGNYDEWMTDRGVTCR